MARILVLSSFTSVGHVGLSAAAPALQALGHAVTQVPTVVLSNMPGFPRTGGGPLPPEQIAAMIDAIEGNGWLAAHDALLIGYLPSAAHVDLAVDLVARVRSSGASPRVVVDPILGDEVEGRYLDEAAATAIRDRLVPLADILTPNCFELGWLARRPVATLADALGAARGIGTRVLVTSPPVVGETGVLDAERAVLYRSPRLAGVPHGVGDVFSGLIAAGVAPDAAAGHLAALCRASAGAVHLALVPFEGWIGAPPLAGEPIGAGKGA